MQPPVTLSHDHPTDFSWILWHLIHKTVRYSEAQRPADKASFRMKNCLIHDSKLMIHNIDGNLRQCSANSHPSTSYQGQSIPYYHIPLFPTRRNSVIGMKIFWIRWASLLNEALLGWCRRQIQHFVWCRFSHLGCYITAKKVSSWVVIFHQNLPGRSDIGTKPKPIWRPYTSFSKVQAVLCLKIWFKTARCSKTRKTRF